MIIAYIPTICKEMIKIFKPISQLLPKRLKIRDGKGEDFLRSILRLPPPQQNP